MLSSDENIKDKIKNRKDLTEEELFDILFYRR